MPRVRPLLALLMLLPCLALAACGGSGDGGTSAASSGTATSATAATTTTATSEAGTTTAATATGGTTPATATVQVFFSDASGQRLVAEQREVPAGADALGAAMRAQADGPEAGDLLPALPAGTTVVGVTRSGATATVDLSARFASAYPQGSAAEIATLAPIVYTATAVPGVSSVRITVGGSTPDLVGSQFDLSQPLRRGDLPDLGVGGP